MYKEFGSIGVFAAYSRWSLDNSPYGRMEHDNVSSTLDLWSLCLQSAPILPNSKGQAERQEYRLKLLKLLNLEVVPDTNRGQ